MGLVGAYALWMAAILAVYLVRSGLQAPMVVLAGLSAAVAGLPVSYSEPTRCVAFGGCPRHTRLSR